MKNLLVMVLLGIVSLAAAQPKDPKFGLSDSRILNMGLGGWINYFNHKTHDDSTLMVELGVETYSTAAEMRNRRLMKKLTRAQKNRLDVLSNAINEFRLRMAEAAATGGTIDGINAEMGVADQHLTLYQVITSVNSRGDYGARNSLIKKAVGGLFGKLSPARLKTVRHEWRALDSAARFWSGKAQNAIYHYERNSFARTFENPNERSP